MAAPRSAAVQIVRPSSPNAGTGASEGAATGKKGKLAYIARSAADSRWESETMS
jgi:hypothetical protein